MVESNTLLAYLGVLSASIFTNSFMGLFFAVNFTIIAIGMTILIIIAHKLINPIIEAFRESKYKFYFFFGLSAIFVVLSITQYSVSFTTAKFDLFLGGWLSLGTAYVSMRIGLLKG